MSAAPAGRLSALLLLLCAALLTGCQAEESRPNILIIVLDDFGYNDLASNNGADSPTPTLDEIAARGVRYTRHYAESSCTPSRVALLTGMYPARVGALRRIAVSALDLFDGRLAEFSRTCLLGFAAR